MKNTDVCLMLLMEALGSSLSFRGNFWFYAVTAACYLATLLSWGVYKLTADSLLKQSSYTLLFRNSYHASAILSFTLFKCMGVVFFCPATPCWVNSNINPPSRLTTLHCSQSLPAVEMHDTKTKCITTPRPTHMTKAHIYCKRGVTLVK